MPSVSDAKWARKSSPALYEVADLEDWGSKREGSISILNCHKKVALDKKTDG